MRYYNVAPDIANLYRTALAAKLLEWIQQLLQYIRASHKLICKRAPAIRDTQQSIITYSYSYTMHALYHCILRKIRCWQNIG